MKNLTRREFLVISGLTGAAAALAACAPKATPAPTAAPTAAPQEAKEEVKEEATAAPAAQPSVELLYYYGGRESFADLPMVEAAMSEMMQAQINATIKLNPIEFSSFTDKMNAKDAAGEKYDLCFTSGWANPYYIKVKNGVLADLTEALPQYAPKYYGGLNPAIWLGPMVGGQIYAAVCQQIFPAAVGPIVREDLAQKYGLNLDEITKLEDLEPFNDKILEGEGGEVIPTETMNFWWSTYWKVDNAPSYGSVYYDDEDIKLQHVWDMPEWKTCLELGRRWYEAGYMDMEVVPAADKQAAVNAGKYGYVIHRAKPGGGAERKAYTGRMYISKILEDPCLLTTGNVISTMYGVNKQTSSLEACVRYLEMVNTDKAFYNLLCKGIEGKHWVWVDKEKEVIAFPEGVTAETHPYNPNTDWEFGDQFNAYYVDPEQVGAWEETRALNDASVPSVLLGFALDTEPIKNEIAEITAAGAEFEDMMNSLMDLETAVPAYVDALNNAGADQVLAEIQRQVDEWKATK